MLHGSLSSKQHQFSQKLNTHPTGPKWKISSSLMVETAISGPQRPFWGTFKNIFSDENRRSGRRVLDRTGIPNLFLTNRTGVRKPMGSVVKPASGDNYGLPLPIVHLWPSLNIPKKRCHKLFSFEMSPPPQFSTGVLANLEEGGKWGGHRPAHNRKQPARDGGNCGPTMADHHKLPPGCSILLENFVISFSRDLARHLPNALTPFPPSALCLIPPLCLGEVKFLDPPTNGSKTIVHTFPTFFYCLKVCRPDREMAKSVCFTFILEKQ